MLDSLKVLSEEAIRLLEKNDLLLSLVKKEIWNRELDSFKVSDEELSNIKKNFLSINKLNDKTFKEWLRENSLSENTFLDKIALPLREKKFFKKNFAPKCQAHFLTRKNDLDQIIYSLIRIKDKFEAKELFLRVQDDESSFGKISKEFSQGPEKNTFGLIGPVPINKAHPSMREVLRSSQLGETNQPFKIGEWWLIVRVESLKEAELNEEMELKMNTELSEIWLQEEAQLIINKLKQKQNISN